MKQTSMREPWEGPSVLASGEGAAGGGVAAAASGAGAGGSGSEGVDAEGTAQQAADAALAQFLVNPNLWEGEPETGRCVRVRVVWRRVGLGELG
jgi:hypothetical protein